MYKQNMNSNLPHLTGVKQYIKLYIEMDYYIFKKNLKIDKFHEKWGNFATMLSTN